MSKKCNSCGADLADDVMFCDKCGAKQEAEVKPEVTDAASSNAGGSKNKIIAVAAIVVVVVVVFILVKTLLSPGYEKPIKLAFNVANGGKVEKLTKSLPDDVLDAYDEKYDDDYADALEDKVDDLKDSYEDMDDCGKNPKFSYEVEGKIKLTDDQLDDIADYYESFTDEELDVTDGYQVAIKVTAKGKDGKHSSFTTVIICKVDGKWVSYDPFFLY